MIRRWTTRSSAVIIPLMALLIATVAPAASPSTPTETVRSTINEVIGILTDPAWNAPARLAERRRYLEEVIGRHFDYREMAKRSLAGHWPTLSPPEQHDFVDLFAAFLSATYADKIEGYAGEDIQFLSERLANGYAEVRTKIVSKKAEYSLDYRLLNRSGEWLVYDVVAEGISLVKNYRGQFDRTIRSASYQELVKKLRQKVNEAKVRTPPR